MKRMTFSEEKQEIELLAQLAKQYKRTQTLLMKLMYIKTNRRLHPVLGKAISGIGHYCKQEDFEGVYRICDLSNKSMLSSAPPETQYHCGNCLRLSEKNEVWRCYYWIVPIRRVEKGNRIPLELGPIEKILKSERIAKKKKRFIRRGKR